MSVIVRHSELLGGVMAVQHVQSLNSKQVIKDACNKIRVTVESSIDAQ